MKKNNVIAFGQKFVGQFNAQVYPTQDYHLYPQGDQYGLASPTPFPEEEGVCCAFDEDGNCCYIVLHSSWHNYFTTSAMERINWRSSGPFTLVSLIVKANDPGVDLKALAIELKNELLKTVRPVENGMA